MKQVRATTSLNAVFLDRVAATPHATAYLVPRHGGFESVPWTRVYDEVRRISAGLRTLGVAGVAVWATTSLQWIVADLATLAAGLATTAIYPSTDAATLTYILDDAEVGVLFVDHPAQLARLGATWPASLAHVVLLQGEVDDPRVLSWDLLRERGDTWLARHGEAYWRAEALEVGPEDRATLIYTSGTTGPPKGVPLTHGNWLAQGEANEEVLGRYAEPGDLLYLWLPLAHAYGKVLQLGGLALGVPLVVDGDLQRLPEVLKTARPTWVPAVPRVFETLRSRVLEQAMGRGPRVERVVRAALALAIEAGRGPLPWPKRWAHAVADRVVYRQIRAQLGGRVRGFLCGSAPLDPDLERMFHGMGLPIYQGYGLTECGALATANLPGQVVVGAVGTPLGAMEVRIHDGEVQLRGPAVMAGYHRRPEADQAVFEDGWFKTGDLGTLDDGVLRITGRAKEILITSGGKNIAPAPIESAVKARCGVIQEVVLVGDGRPTVMALVTLDPETLQTWAQQQGMAPDPLSSAVRELIGAAITEANAEFPRYATIKDFVVLPVPFSEATGELTPSQKVRRGVVMDHHRARIDALYGV